MPQRANATFGPATRKMKATRVRPKPSPPMNLLRTIAARTVLNVKFGIALMVLVAAYVAIGSGVPAVREWLEMNELEFFAWWPFLLLLGLLVTNLVLVTFNRIPFTPPRYGVWCVHAGIITLIWGMTYYYTRKVEGLTLIPVGQTVGQFYDGQTRALYAAVGERRGVPVPLESLPRFKEAGEQFGSGDRLDRADLRGIQPNFYALDPQTNALSSRPLDEALGLSVPVSMRVVDYWPYAGIEQRYETDPKSDERGVMLSRVDAKDGATESTFLPAGSPPLVVGAASFEYRALPDADALAAVKQAAGRVSRIDARIDGGPPTTLYVEPGGTYKAGPYTLGVERIDPSFPMFGTGEIVQTLTLSVEGPTGKFRRMLLNGKPLQTDFKLGEPGAGPMGKRQKAPLDDHLVLNYALNDPLGLSPTAAPERHVFLTAGDGKDLLHVRLSLDGPTRFEDLSKGAGDIAVAPESHAPHDGHGQEAEGPTMMLARLREHVKKVESVVITPMNKRDQNVGQGTTQQGTAQVVKVRVTAGKWSGDVLVPYTQFPDQFAWHDGEISIPGAAQPLRLQLGNLRRPLPAALRLDQFEVVPYAGGLPQAGSIMRDFKSHLTVIDRQTGQGKPAVAQLNNPVYFGNGSWLFYQAQWDPEGQRWTILGVGNRPGMAVMITGCGLIFAGLLYSFYAKPYVIRAMKRRALRKAGFTTEGTENTEGKKGRKKAAKQLEEADLATA